MNPHGYGTLYATQYMGNLEFLTLKDSLMLCKPLKISLLQQKVEVERA